MKYLLDTNIIIYIIKQKPKNVLEKFSHLNISDVAISAISVAELFYGVNKSSSKEKNMQALQEFLLPLEIIVFNEDDAFVYGMLRSDLEKNGNLIGSMDMLIASQSLAKDLILVSNNTKEFGRIKNLKLENWV